MNLARLVLDNAERLPDKVAIRHGEQSLSYAACWQRILELRHQIAAAGAGSGERVGLCMADHSDHVLAHFAVAALGAVIVPVDHRWTRAEKQRAASSFALRVMLVDSDPIPDVRCIRPDSASPAAPGEDAIAGGDDDDVLISLSSGTTGRPKGALLSHRNFLERFRAQWSAIGYGENDCFALTTPLYFGAGRSFSMSLLTVGGSLRLAPPPMRPEQLATAISQPDVTATFLPPTLLRRLLPLADGDACLFANLDYLIVSGEPLRPDEAGTFRQKISDRLYSYYASSEGGGISLLQPDDFTTRADTVGRVMPGTEVEIVDAENRALAAGNVGRLRYRGAGVADRTVSETGQVENITNGGWFYPGDLAELTADGYVRLRGRDSDVIIRAGVNVYPVEIENALLQHPDIDDAVVVGIDDEDRGSLILAFCVGRATNLDAHLQDRLAPYKIPSSIQFLDELPKLASGKTDRKALRALWKSISGA